MIARLVFIGIMLAASALAATQHYAHSIRINGVMTAPAGASPNRGVVVATGGAGRISAGLDLMRDGAAERMLISGTGEGVRKLDITRLILRSGQFDETRLGLVMECCVDLGPAATNTRGNAEESKRWADRHDLDSLVVVTSDYHLPRTMMVFRDLLPQHQLIPHGVNTPWLNLDATGGSGWWHNPTRIGIISLEMIKFYASRMALI
ncbi:MAG: YdcF family protein [Alphaproteobacteria bacterium]|nr:YdcF family protein [Alphaproteobacteria bacterium]